MSDQRRVVITGIGPITPIGIGREALWEGLRRQRSPIRTVTRFDASRFRSRNAAEVDDFDPSDFIAQKQARRFDRFGQFSVAAARLAVADADLHLDAEDRERIGVMMGSALGGLANAEDQVRFDERGGIKAVDPSLALTAFAGAASCNIAIELGVHGPNSTNAMSCASGTIAIGEAYRAIRYGYADAMLAGAAEAPLAPLCFGAFTIIRAMSTRNDDPSHASRPFDRDRDGFVMGEGACVLVLEARDRAMARGAPVYAEITGFGVSNDAYHMAAPRPDGAQAARAMRLALEDAHVAPGDVAYVNAHGSGTPLNDPTETAAIRSVFGEHTHRLPVSSTKAYYGHALGASGAIETAISTLAIARRWLPPTLNLDAPDAACDLDHIAHEGRAAEPEFALTNSFGFGGINASLLLFNER